MCNGEESCQAGVCQPGPSPDCEDGNPCTVDSCNEGLHRCDHLPAANGSPCADANACNGQEACQGGTCQAGTAHGLR